MMWRLMFPPLSQKVAKFYKVCLKKLAFFLIFDSILQASFFDKMVALSNKKSTFDLASGFFGCRIFKICPKII